MRRLRVWQDEYRAEVRAQGAEQGIAAERDLTCYTGRRRASSAPAPAERLAGLLAKIGDSHKIRKKVNTEKPQ